MVDNQEEAIFDGEILKRRLEKFLHRINNALSSAQEVLSNHEIDQIIVNLTVDASLNIGLAGMAGGGLSRATTFSFVLRLKQQI